jgi:hypothetical protein
MKIRNIIIGATVFGALAVGAASYALTQYPRTPVEFYQGHTHGEDGQTVGAPAHSGGTDAYGCHNRSVPYHCH